MDRVKTALLVGLQYNNELTGPYNDLKILKKVLTQKKFEVLTIDDKNGNSVICSDLKLLFSKILNKSDEIYFHFSGHSVVENEKKYLILTDSKKFDIEELLQKNEFRNKKVFGTFDCCEGFYFPLRWKLENNGDIFLLKSNSCNFNINENIIFIGSSQQKSKNIRINEKSKSYGCLSYAMKNILNEIEVDNIFKMPEILIEIYKKISYYYLLHEVNDTVVIFTGKKYILYKNDI